MIVPKRSLPLRCLVLLLSLTLANGNAHAALHLDIAHPEPCPEGHAHHHGKTEPQHQHRHDKALACCCDCLGCSAAVYLSPPLGVTPADLPARVNYDALTASLGRCGPIPFLPDPARRANPARVARRAPGAFA